MLAGAFLRRDAALTWCGLSLTVALSWAYLWTGAGTLEDMGGMLMPMSSGPWTANHAAIMLLMWAAMMAAMMLPSASPMILLYGTISRRRRSKGEKAASAGIFALGYLAIWLAFCLGAVALQYGLERLALLSPMMQTTSLLLSAAVLIGAGIYQWTPLKQSCLRRCRSPLEFVLTEWRDGAQGALVMGLRHGAYCLGCCWVLMLLLFVGGIMNLAWIAGLSVFVLVEKLVPAGHWVSRAAGLILIAWGAATLAA